jgi:hypothetical protein
MGGGEPLNEFLVGSDGSCHRPAVGGLIGPVDRGHSSENGYQRRTGHGVLPCCGQLLCSRDPRAKANESDNAKDGADPSDPLLAGRAKPVYLAGLLRPESDCRLGEIRIVLW